MHATEIDPDYSVLSIENTWTHSWQTIWPEFVVVYDLDDDLIDDDLELQIAEKFKPILHKHSYDLQAGLQNFDNLLADGSFTLKVYNDNGQELHSEQIIGGQNSLHKWSLWHWDTYGAGSQSNEVYNLDLIDSKRYSSAPIGQRPVYYHVYKDATYHYVQYWYYMGMNDITEQATGWHESDWEHVSIRLTQNGGVFSADKVNFYRHEGGNTVSANSCWWSGSNTLTYSGIQQGYDENHTNLHVWIAANGHASYNRYSKLYKSEFSINPLGPLQTYKDRLDYDPSGYDLYFPYDILIKLGEVSKQSLVECPDSGYSLEFHSYPLGSGSKHWLAYRGRTGWFSHTGSPFMPAKESANPSHEWTFFTDSPNFGNIFFLFEVVIFWILDDAVGD